MVMRGRPVPLAKRLYIVRDAKREGDRAGLSWDEAQSHRSDQSWRGELEENRRQPLELGFWGVPSSRVQGGGQPDFCTWRQDRIRLVERELAKRLGRRNDSASAGAAPVS